MQGNHSTTMSEAMARGQRHVSGKPSATGASKIDIEMLKAKLREYTPLREPSKFDVVRAMFEILEEKCAAGATYVQLAAYLSANDFDIREQTLKTLMSKIRTEMKVKRINCPCCQTNVPESQISEEYRLSVTLEDDGHDV
ncbi:hypothetical protein PQQ51_31030 [Paraburkholderia xenovorans]|uniref:hypothetical protein n=1 Tax=Paraburkholderia xenovorans TaxID=36873 RepID=UPI0038B729EF